MAGEAAGAGLRSQIHFDGAARARLPHDQPWDEADADALADAYEQAGHQIVDAAAWQRSPWLDTALVEPRPPRPQAIDQAWLDQRLADLTRQFEQTLTALKPDAAIADLGQRLDGAETRLSATVTRHIATSIQTASGNVPRQVSEAVSGVLVSNALTGLLDRTVNKAVTNAVNSHIADAVGGVLSSSQLTGLIDRTVNKAVSGAVNGQVTSSMTGAVTNAVTSAVTSAVGGAVTSALAGAVGSRMDAITAAVTAAVNGSVATAVGGRMDFIDDTVRSAISSSVTSAVDTSINARLDAVTGTIAGAVSDTISDAIADAVSLAINGALKSSVTDVVTTSMQDVMADHITLAVSHTVNGAMSTGISRSIELAVAGAVSGAVTDALAASLPSALADTATKADIDGLYGVHNQIHDVLDRFERSDDRLARLDDLEHHMRDIADRLADDRLGRLLDGQVPAGADVERVARLASEQVAREMLARMPDPSRDTSSEMADIRTLLETVISEQRQGDEMTSNMLDTLQQAMLAVLDRVDALEAGVEKSGLALEAGRPDAGGRPADKDERRDQAAAAVSMEPHEMAARLDRMTQAEEAAERQRLTQRGEPALRGETLRAEPARSEFARSEADLGRNPRRAAADNPVSDRLPMRAAGAARAPEAAKPAEPARDEFLTMARRVVRSSGPGAEGDGSASAVEGRTPPRARVLPSDQPAGPQSPAKSRLDRRGLVAIIAVLALGAGYRLLSGPTGDATVVAQLETDRPAITTLAAADAGSQAESAAPGAAGETPVLAVAGTAVDPAVTEGRIVEAEVATSGSPPAGILLQSDGMPLSPEAVMMLRRREEAARLSAQVGASAYRLPVSDRLSIGVTPTAAGPAGAATAGERLDAARSAGRTIQAAPATTSSLVRTIELDLPAATVGPLSLRRAAAGGDPSAQFEVASRLAEGRGTPQDFAGAALWYSRAVEQGFAPAQFRLATMYERGLGVAADLARAKDLYRQAADRGHVKSMHNLAVVLANAKTASGEPDYAAALPWFKRAADHGLTDSQYNLAVLYESGLGLTRDVGEAYKWQALAARGGDKQALKRRDILAQQLAPAERDVLDRQIAAWQLQPSDRTINDARMAGEAWKSRAAGGV